MALATETDPVQTVIDLLDATTDSDFTGSKPAHVERYEEREARIKAQRSGDALYVFQPAETDVAQLAADYSALDHSSVVHVEAWTLTGSAKAWELAEDVHDHVTTQYGVDNKSSTQWQVIRPTGFVDFRQGSKAARRADHFIEAVQLVLSGLRAP